MITQVNERYKKMTRKHYRAIAQAIKDNTSSNNINKVDFISDISDIFKRDNINFNYYTFRDACD